MKQFLRQLPARTVTTTKTRDQRGSRRLHAIKHGNDEEPPHQRHWET